MTSSHHDEKERARRLILRHGQVSTAYQLLNPGIRYWFANDEKGLVGYVRRAGMRIVAGSPVAADDDLEEVARSFEADAKEAGENVCYFCAESDLQSLYSGRPGYRHLIIGGQPAWNPQGWRDIIDSKSSLRAQLNRASNKGVAVEQWSGDRFTERSELQALLEVWLDQRALPPMHFLVEPRTLPELRDRQVFVAREDGDISGFLVTSPVPQKKGWLVEQTVRHPHAANGTAELLIHKAAASAAEEGDTYFTLGLAPLAQRFVNRESVHSRFLWWLIKALQIYGQRFYNFAGLEYFKSKFQPHYWEPMYAIINRDTFSIRSMYAIASAFTGGSPTRWVAQSLWQKMPRQINH